MAARPVAQAKERRGSEHDVAFQSRLDRGPDGPGDTVGDISGGCRGEHPHQPPEGRIAERPTALELAVQELGHSVSGGEHDRAKLGVPCLDDHPPARIPGTPGPTRELGEQCERPLLGAEVRDGERLVGVDHRRELHTGDVVALRDELRADQHRGLGAAKPAQRPLRLPGLRGHIGVQPDDLEPREPPLKLGLHAGRPSADLGEVDRAARRTGLRHRLGCPAVVAAQAAAVQRPHRHVRAQVRQWSAAAAPRRFWRTMARPPPSSISPSASSSGRVSG